MQDLGSKCEYCHKYHAGDYGSGRFCSAKCARGFSTKARREEISEKVSKTLKRKYVNGRLNKFLADPQFQHAVAKRGAVANHAKHLARLVKVKTTNRVFHELDITYKELEEYRGCHPRCEICGALPKDGRQLACDHDHKSLKFRGLLCTACNRKLGWYEHLKENIAQYLGEQV